MRGLPTGTAARHTGSLKSPNADCDFDVGEGVTARLRSAVRSRVVGVPSAALSPLSGAAGRGGRGGPQPYTVLRQPRGNFNASVQRGNTKRNAAAPLTPDTREGLRASSGSALPTHPQCRNTPAEGDRQFTCPLHGCPRRISLKASRHLQNCAECGARPPLRPKRVSKNLSQVRYEYKEYGTKRSVGEVVA